MNNYSNVRAGRWRLSQGPAARISRCATCTKKIRSISRVFVHFAQSPRIEHLFG